MLAQVAPPGLTLPAQRISPSSFFNICRRNHSFFSCTWTIFEKRSIRLPVVVLVIGIQDKGIGHLTLQLLYYRMVFPVLLGYFFQKGAGCGHNNPPALNLQFCILGLGVSVSPLSFGMPPNPVAF